MNFRGSIYLVKDSVNTEDMSWFESHQAKQGYIVAKLTGDPTRVKRPGQMALWFHRAGQDTTRPQTLPACATVLQTAPNAAEAIKALFALEKEMAATHQLFDIGDCPVQGIKHYAALMARNKLPPVPLPKEIIDAVKDFVDRTSVYYLFGGTPRYMMNEAIKSLKLYKTLPTAEPKP